MRGTMALAALASVAMAPLAHAADLGAPVVFQEVETSGIGNGWYLRGEIGAGLATELGVTSNGAEFLPHPNYPSPISASFAVGYEFNDFVRFDLGFDYIRYSFSEEANGCLMAACPVPLPQSQPATSGQAINTEMDGNAQAYTVSANAFLSPGRYGSFSPFIGFGAGLTYVAGGNVTATTTYQYVHDQGTPADATDDVQFQESFRSFDHFESDWRVTWSAMAGMEYAATPELSVDVLYRYEYIGDIAVEDTTSPLPNMEMRGMNSHQLRLGLRYRPIQ
ncbi:MAG: porin family protein [Hyphomicrobiaceae bacterium]|nr:porin family protein [Hyphomicrobiaceae bacterium]